MPELYVVTIVKARYGGTYEGGPWLAFELCPDQLPEDWDAGDIECMEFWANPENSKDVGIGQSPDLALKELQRKTGKT